MCLSVFIPLRKKQILSLKNVVIKYILHMGSLVDLILDKNKNGFQYLFKLCAHPSKYMSWGCEIQFLKYWLTYREIALAPCWYHAALVSVKYQGYHVMRDFSCHAYRFWRCCYVINIHIETLGSICSSFKKKNNKNRGCINGSAIKSTPDAPKENSGSIPSKCLHLQSLGIWCSNLASVGTGHSMS